MKKLRFKGLILGSLAIVLVVAACGGGGDGTSTSAPQPTAAPAPTAVPAPMATPVPTGPRRGGSLTLPIPQGLKSTDPHTSSSAGKEVWLQASDVLVEVDDQQFALKPGLLESWTADGNVFTLKVRQGVKWQNLPPVNGREFVADDVIYNMRRIKGDFPREGARWIRSATMSAVEGLQAVDSHTVRVTLKAPSISFIGGLATVFSPMVPKELVDACGGGLDPTLSCTIGTGPFILTSFEDGIQSEWERNPNFWKTGADGQSLPYLDSIKWVWFGDVATIVASIASGQSAMYQKAGSAEIASLKATNAKVKLWPYDKTVVWQMHLNHTRAPFNDIRARQAIHLALERRSSLDLVQGDAPWTYTGFLPSIFGDFVLPASEIANLPGFRDDKTEDVPRAQALMAELGFGPSNKLKLRAFASESSTCGRECPVLIADQLNKHLGDFVEVEPAPVPRAERSQRRGDKDYDIFYAALAADFPDPGPVLRQWFHSEGGRNVTGYSSPELDAMIDAQDSIFDLDARKQAIIDIQQKILDDVANVVWGNTWAIMVMLPNINGWVPGPDVLGGDIFYDLDEVWIGDDPTPSSWPIIVGT